jgi:hypothetical protein
MPQSKLAANFSAASLTLAVVRLQGESASTASAMHARWYDPMSEIDGHFTTSPTVASLGPFLLNGLLCNPDASLVGRLLVLGKEKAITSSFRRQFGGV